MLRLLAPLCVLVMCLLLVSDATGAGKKKKAQKIQGSVVKVELASGATDEGTLTVMTTPKKKKNAPAEAGKEIVVQIKKSTKIEKQAGKKMPPTAATFADLQAGQRVTVSSDSGSTVPTSVVILNKKKKKTS